MCDEAVLWCCRHALACISCKQDVYITLVYMCFYWMFSEHCAGSVFFFRLIEIKNKIIAVRSLVLAPACSPAIASSRAKLNHTAIRHAQINLRGWRWDAALIVVVKIRLCAITFGFGLLNEMNILCTVVPQRSTHWREQLKAFIVLNIGCRLDQKEIELFW